MNVCFLCALYGDDSEKYCHKHHVYEGKNRQASDKAGFVVYLCPEHHREVHDDRKLNEILKRITQREYEKTHTREEFMKIIGRNYLDS